MKASVRDKFDETGFVARSEELIAVVRRWISALEAKDTQVLTALFSQSDSMRYVGSAEEEIFQGELLRKGYGDHVNEIPDIHADCQMLEAFARVRTGWALWLGTIHFLERDARVPYRFSMVCTLEAGIWKIVQVHVSSARPNLETAGMEHMAFQRLIEAAKCETDVFDKEGTATIMFTDVANSTSIAAFSGDRAWAEAIGHHFDEVRSIIEANDGKVVKTLGDGTMSNFPSALARMRAALDIQDAAAIGGDDMSMQVRIGLHSGDVVQAQGDFFGSVVNKAARIAAIAEPGSILVSEVTRAMAEGNRDLRFEVPRSVVLRGVEGSHLVSRLLKAD